MENAALFMLKRYPPVCNDNEVVDSTKPQFVQLMLVDRYGGRYHRALLQAKYNYRDQLKFKLLLSNTGKDDACDEPTNPSVLPGTLFMLNYK